jgi:hypothetical protein
VERWLAEPVPPEPYLTSDLYAKVLLADHALHRLEADLRWIDCTAARLDLLARAVHR